uniref:dachshund homolog 1-like n=1 Tax=Myxine glutinosa TaxID=7769 RepID=UPI00358F0E68
MACLQLSLNPPGALSSSEESPTLPAPAQPPTPSVPSAVSALSSPSDPGYPTSALPCTPGSISSGSTLPCAPGSTSSGSALPCASGSTSSGPTLLCTPGSASSRSALPSAPGSASSRSALPYVPGSAVASSSAPALTCAPGSASSRSTLPFFPGSISSGSTLPFSPGSTSSGSALPYAPGSTLASSSGPVLPCAPGSAVACSSGLALTCAPGSASSRSTLPCTPGPAVVSSPGPALTCASAGSASSSRSALPCVPHYSSALPCAPSTHSHSHSSASAIPGKASSSTAPSPVESTPANNECRLVELRSAKVASFNVGGRELVCLPQAFDLFLKHLVGGLHTVYTKLKRLHIAPVVCNVEQVRVLRGLGAIQPGVNRCKLISRKDFEALYNDCTNASSRPGRPPKRAHSLLPTDAILHPNMLPPGVLSQSGSGVASAFSEALKMKKIKMEAINGSQGNGSHGCHSNVEPENGQASAGHSNWEAPWERDKASSPSVPVGVGMNALPGAHAASSHPLNQLQQAQMFTNGLDHLNGSLPFMMMPHPLLGLPHATVSMAMGHVPHLGGLAGVAAAASQAGRHDGTVIKERVTEPERESPRSAGSPGATRQSASRPASSLSCSPPPQEAFHQNGFLLSHSMPGAHSKDEHPETKHDGKDHLTTEQGDTRLVGCTQVEGPEATLPRGLLNNAASLLLPEVSSVEGLLANIQGLVRLAGESWRAQDKAAQLEQAELRLELLRERELRQALERQLLPEQRARGLLQKRLKKEKRAKRRLQEALELEVQRRSQAEQALTQVACTDALQGLADNSHHGYVESGPEERLSCPVESLNNEIESSTRSESDRNMQDTCLFYKKPTLY